MRSIPCGRILVAFAGYVLLCMPRAASAYPSYSVNDIRVSEGNTGTTTATFTVSRSETGAATVTYYTKANPPGIGATEGSGACGGASDYLRTSGTLSFSTSERSKTINIPICPDYTPEQDESFIILVGKNMAKCTILNDDSPNVDVVDYVETEGNSGSPRAMFRVNLSSPPTQTVTVWYIVSSPSPMHGTADTATAGTTCGGSADYIGVTSGTTQFFQGEVQKLVYVSICPDTTPEPDETFHIQLTRAEGAVIRDGSGLGTIRNDDLPVLTVQDFTVAEAPNDQGLVAAYCTLKLNSTSHNGCSVDYTVVSGTATVGSTNCDVSSTGGTETFPAGDDEETITLGICGDTLREGNETFQIQFSNARGLSMPDTIVVGTITDND